MAPRLADDVLRDVLAPPSGVWRPAPGLRDSAVLIVLVRRGEFDHLVFNLRRDDLESHAGQVCFPGGAREGDEDAVECALRETEEELGLPATAMDLLGRLPERTSIAGFRVTPFVARLRRPLPYTLDASEVAEVFEVSLDTLLERERWSFRTFDRPPRRYRDVPFFASDAHTVWGLTGLIVCDFLRIAADFEANA